MVLLYNISSLAFLGIAVLVALDNDLKYSVTIQDVLCYPQRDTVQDILEWLTQ